MSVNSSLNITQNNGQLLIGSSGLTPVASTLTPGPNVTITNGPGTITVGASPQYTVAGVGASNPSLSMTPNTFYVTGNAATPVNVAYLLNPFAVLGDSIYVSAWGPTHTVTISGSTVPFGSVINYLGNTAALTVTFTPNQTGFIWLMCVSASSPCVYQVIDLDNIFSIT